MLHHLVACVQAHLDEGDAHGEDHPDVNHLDIRCYRQALGDTQEAENNLLSKIRHQLKTYKVARTNNMVRLTWMTMST